MRNYLKNHVKSCHSSTLTQLNISSSYEKTRAKRHDIKLRPMGCHFQQKSAGGSGSAEIFSGESQPSVSRSKFQSK